MSQVRRGLGSSRGLELGRRACPVPPGRITRAVVRRVPIGTCCGVRGVLARRAAVRSIVASASASPSASANSFMVGKRSAGVFSSARKVASSTSSGTDWRTTWMLGTCSSAWRARIAMEFGPSNGGWPDEQLVEHAAEAVLVAPPVHCRRRATAPGSCSAGVPTAMPVWVSFSPADSTARAMPKSATRAWPPWSRMFSGLMSRWTMPCSWAYCERFRGLARDPEGVVDRKLLLPVAAGRGADSPSMNGMT